MSQDSEMAYLVSLLTVRGNRPVNRILRFLDLPAEIRIHIYEDLLAAWRDELGSTMRSQPNVPRPPRPSPDLSIRLVCRQLADETFEYVFHTLKLDDLVACYDPMAPARKNVVLTDLERFQGIVKGRWKHIRYLQTKCSNMPSASLMDFLDREAFSIISEPNAPFVGRLIESQSIDTVGLQNGWGKYIRWPKELRYVSTITLTEAKILTQNDWSRIAAVLVLLKVYFPLLVDVRIQCLRRISFSSTLLNWALDRVERFRIDGLWLGRWYNREHFKPLPNIALVQADGSIRNTSG
jgi:hypothetical protein